MRGPMVRIQSDIRRLWRCPKCHYERRAHATQTTVRCHCNKDAPFMQLVESQRPARSIPEDLPPYFEYEADANEEAEELVEPVTQSEAETGEAPPSVSEETESSTENPPTTQEDAVQNTTLDPAP